MDVQHFDALVRHLAVGRPRRGVLGLLGGAVLGVRALGLMDERAAAKKRKKKKKKKCQPCQIKKKGKCKGPKPDGTACGDGKVCQGGQCVAACDPACEPPGQCVNGACVCPSPLESCGAVCCVETPECQDNVCACDGEICSCPAGDQICNTADFGQCCLSTDTCDPELLCTTQSCSAGNDFCNPEWAYCGDHGSLCSCATSMEGESVCGEFDPGLVCPDTSECENDSGCDQSEVCINACCDDENPKGACVPRCGQQLAHAERSRSARHAKEHILARR